MCFITKQYKVGTFSVLNKFNRFCCAFKWRILQVSRTECGAFNFI